MQNILALNFLHWYWIYAPTQIVSIGENLLLWGWNYFSIGYFVPRLFAPWHKDLSSYGRGFDFKRFFHVLGWNLISRVIGAFLRIFVMIAGLIIELLIAVGGFVFLIIWFCLPLLVPFLSLQGFWMLLGI